MSRNVQRQRGEAADATRPRLASIEPRADDWFDPGCHDRVQRWRLQLPDAAALRQYLAETLDTTLDLLAGADDSDAGLYVYRLALLHEDRLGEALAVARAGAAVAHAGRRVALAAAAGARAARAAVVRRAALHARLRARRPGAAERTLGA